VTAESPEIAQQIEKIRCLELSGTVSWVEASQLIEAVHEAWDPVDLLPLDWPLSVFQLARLRLLDLQARYLLGRVADSGRQRGVPRSQNNRSLLEPLQMSREQLVGAILDRSR
jgi:hypothetical protein